MSSTTDNLNLVKQANSENWSNDTHNANLQKIDDFAAKTNLTKPALLNSSHNMDNVTEGVYYQAGSSMPSNAPTSANNASITVVKAGSTGLAQYWISTNQNKVYYRTRYSPSDAWTAWTQLALNSDIGLFSLESQRENLTSAGWTVDDLLSGGVYKFTGKPTDTPGIFSNTFGLIMVIHRDNYYAQIIFDGLSRIVVRTKAGSASWTNKLVTMTNL